jgi:hypothetical protein
MSRISSARIHARAISAAKALALPVEEIWASHSGPGWSVFRQFGAGAQALAECLTAREADNFLKGLEIGATLVNGGR